MTKDRSIIVDEDGLVIDQVALVPLGDASTLKEVIPYNRMTNIAKSTLTRLTWDKRVGVWKCSLGEFTELKLTPIAATELYAVWTSEVGRPQYYDVKEPEGYEEDEVEMGYRVAFTEEIIGPCYGDFFGLSRDFAEAVCKMAHHDKGKVITVKGSTTISTGNGPFHAPKIVR